MKSCGSSKTWTNPGSSHSISYFFEADGFCFAHTALYSLHTRPQIPTHRLDTEAEKKKKKRMVIVMMMMVVVVMRKEMRKMRRK